ncbi:multidrug DMT transporter permease [Legionella waltersii]|uniref:Ecto-ATP diphosphohydrolase II n=1 Tax=Legionella waltersii TaxID=66969 RepID=A0A0W1ANZ6_9GAMM|nr:multidrug DMT transporter permease [Legionella waltersii]KTD82990.1 ecto-ATP diphosphohydrolase II [Legionella waltersii]SNV07509.1 ecto-ATP diphosphohydrolase I [Legionella waltersii]
MHKFIIWIIITCSLSFSVFAEKSDCINRHCIAVIDAGSTGSRLHIYSYVLDDTNTPIDIKEIWNRKAVPGLSTIEHEHKSISVYMEKLFADAPAVTMPVYFYSTGGMRLLPKTHHKNVNQLVADWFDKQYYWRLIKARTISGTEEGVFAWLAINYQLNLFNQQDTTPTGVMDIGGASVQIVIPIKDGGVFKGRDLVTMSIYGKTYTIYSRSFLGLGQNEMGHQYFDLKYCYPKEFELPRGHLGQGDASLCKNEISILVNDVHYVSKKVNGILKSNPVDKWYILGGITSMLHDKLFSFNKNKFTMSELFNLADQNICHQKWSTLEETNPDNFMLYNYCMLPSYLYALIVNGYGIKNDQQINFLPQNKNADWTIGVVLQHQHTKVY